MTGDGGDQGAGQRPVQLLADRLHDDLVAQIGGRYGGVQQDRAGNVAGAGHAACALRIRAATITS